MLINTMFSQGVEKQCGKKKVKKKKSAGKRKTTKREEVKVRASTLTGEKPLRKVPLNAVKLLTRNYMDVLSARKKLSCRLPSACHITTFFQVDATFWKITVI